MRKEKARNRCKTRLSSRNALGTLNELVRVPNEVLPEEEGLQPARTSRDLFLLRRRIKTLSLLRSQRQEVDLPQSPSKPLTEEGTEGNCLPREFIRAVTTIATNAWRARNKMVDVGSGEPKDGMKRVYRHIEAVFDALREIGFEVRDMQGRPFDSGMALKVITFEPTPGLSQEEITETIKPTITWQGQLVQVGEVIVGTPQTK